MYCHFSSWHNKLLWSNRMRGTQRSERQVTNRSCRMMQITQASEGGRGCGKSSCERTYERAFILIGVIILYVTDPRKIISAHYFCNVHYCTRDCMAFMLHLREQRHKGQHSDLLKITMLANHLSHTNKPLNTTKTLGQIAKGSCLG